MIKTVQPVQFQPEHLDQILPRAVFGGDDLLKPRILAFAGNPLNRVRTITFDGKPVAIVAMLFMWPGVAEVVSVTSEDVKKAPVSFHRLVRDLMMVHAKNMKLHRLQVTAKCDFAAGKRWIEALGFSLEGTLQQFGPDRANYYIYGRVV